MSTQFRYWKTSQLLIATGTIITSTIGLTLPMRAEKLLIPKMISCDKATIRIVQTTKTLSYDHVRAAAFTLTVNGITEPAIGIESGNSTKVESVNFYVYGGTGGLTFGNNNKQRDVVCTNSKYGQPSHNFSYE
jgi:hypothetical protein